LPGKLAPQRPDDRSVGLADGVARGDLVSDEDHPPYRRKLRHAGFLKHAVDAGHLSGRRIGEEMIEGQHRVGLSPAEVRLQLHDGVAALAGQALHGPYKQSSEALRQVGAMEELNRVTVFVSPFPQVDLPEVRGELGLLVPAAGHVLMRADHLPPGLQAARDLAFDGAAGALSLLGAHLLVENRAPKLRLHLPDFIGLERRDGRQQPLARVEGPVCIVAGKGLLVGPSVPNVPQLAHQGPFRLAERPSEHVVPGLPHQAKQRRGIPLRQGLARVQAVISDEFPRALPGLVLVEVPELALDEGSKASLQEVHCLAHALVIGDRHRLLLIEDGSLR